MTALRAFGGGGGLTRAGGVSDGVYESLNGGVGSEDSPAKVAENRARMAKHLGVAPDRFLTCYQIHSPEVVVASDALIALMTYQNDGYALMSF